MVDVVVNAAGILERSRAIDHTLESWERTIDVNLRAPFRLIRAIACNARERPGAGRAVVNVCSYESYRGATGHVAYTVSKGALASLTRAAAYELGPLGVRVNGVLPGRDRDGDERASCAPTRRRPRRCAPVTVSVGSATPTRLPPSSCSSPLQPPRSSPAASSRSTAG